MVDVPVPRLIRPNLDPVGLYLRAGYNDHKDIANAILAGRTHFTGVVVDAHRMERHREMLDLVEKTNLECVLDPCTQAASMPGGYSEALGALPWGRGRRHELADFESTRLLGFVTSIAKFAIEHRCSEVIAPTHYLEGPDDPWLETDIKAARGFRAQLDRGGGKKIGLIYLLTVPYALLRDKAAVAETVERLRGVPMDALWIRIDGFGDHSTGAAVRHFLDASVELHKLDVPIVADQVGGMVGLALVAMSTVGGLSHGITQRERFDAGNWKKVSSGPGFAMPHRVYFPALDLYLKTSDAKRLFEGSMGLRNHFGCSDPKCCPRGITDMIERPGAHFLNQRMNQLSVLGSVTSSIRPQEFLQRYMRPTADSAVRFGQSKSLNDSDRERVMRQRKRLDLLRISLEDIVESKRPSTASALPETRAAREYRMGMGT
jgi:hypothetical protein